MDDTKVEKPTPLYMMLGIRIDKEEKNGAICIMGVNPNKEEAKKLAQERALAEGLQGPDDWVVVNINQDAQDTGNQIKGWLVLHDIIGAEANGIVRLVGQNLLKIFDHVSNMEENSNG